VTTNDVPDEVPWEWTNPDSLMDGRSDEFLAACRAAIGDPPRSFEDDDLAYLLPAPPDWLDPSDPFTYYFEDRRRILHEARVVWGVIVQANNLLFAPGAQDHPADVLFAPSPDQVQDPDTLLVVSERLFTLKETTPDDADLARFAHHLTNERERDFAMHVPEWLSAGVEMEMSAAMLHRAHLPSGFLRRGTFPLLVASDPRLVMVLPQRYWPAGLVEWWEDGYEPPPAPEPPARWLASLIGAYHDGARADFVIDSDQLLVLRGTHTTAAAPARLHLLRSADREALLAEDPHNRKVAVSEIARVTMTKLSPLTHKEREHGKVTVVIVGGEELVIRLDSKTSMARARETLATLLGSRFES
jgi:hypothetical protein